MMKTAEIVSLNALDRCDRCGSQAYVVARKADLSDLMFCLHHHKKHADALFVSGWEVIEDYNAISKLSPNARVGV